MTDGERDWLERQIRAWDARSTTLAGAAGSAADHVRAECLAIVAAGLRHRLALAPPREPPITMPTDVGMVVTWRSPAFWRDGKFDPFSAPKSLRMLASAAVCRALGEHGTADGYERYAAELAGDEHQEPAQPPRWGARADFSFPVPEALPFEAGPQMDLFG